MAAGLEFTRCLRLAPAHEFPAVFHSRDTPLDEFFCRRSLRVRVADYFVSDRAAHQPVNGHANGFALDVPEGDVYATDGTGVDLVGGEETASEHLLPEPLGRPRVLSDDYLREVFDGFLDCGSPEADAHFADAGDAGVCLDDDEVVLASIGVFHRV